MLIKVMEQLWKDFSNQSIMLIGDINESYNDWKLTAKKLNLNPAMEPEDFITRSQSGKHSALDHAAGNLNIAVDKAEQTTIKSDHRLITYSISTTHLKITQPKRILKQHKAIPISIEDTAKALLATNWPDTSYIDALQK